MDEGGGVGEFDAVLIWRGASADRGGSAEEEPLGADGDLGGEAAGGDGGLLRERSLRLLEVAVAAVVKTEFVGEGRAPGVQPASEKGVDIDVLGAEAANAAVDDGSRSNSGGRAEAGAVALQAELVAGCDLGIEFEKVDGLVGAARDDAGEAVEVGEGGGDLRRGDAAIAQESELGWGEVVEGGALGRGDGGEAATLGVEGIEVEEPAGTATGEDWAADGSAELLAVIGRFDECGGDAAARVMGGGGEGVDRGPGAFADEKEGGAVKVGGTGLRDGTDDSTGCVSVGGGVALAGDAELADGGLGEGEVGTGAAAGAGAGGEVSAGAA